VAFFGFRARLSDGREARETDGLVTWDDVPDGISRLELVEFSDQGEREVAAFEGAPGRRFFAYNETAAFRGGQGVLCAKAIGCIEGSEVREARLDMLPRLQGMPPVLSCPTYPETRFSLDERALRRSA
jgi:hypothetical protein